MIHVVAAAVTDAAGRVLIAQRLPGKHLAGGWEFPGGKLEAGESRTAGLARELREELGIVLTGPPRPLIRVRHTYPYGEVLIDMWVVSRYEGYPQGMDGQALRWLSLDELETAELLPADRPIVRVLRLPERLTRVSTTHYEIVGSLGADQGGKMRGLRCATIDAARAAASLGAEFLVMQQELTDPEISELCRSVDVPVFVRSSKLELDFSLGASGCNETPT